MVISQFDPKIKTRLEEFLCHAQGGEVAVFDLDNTCVLHDTGEAVFYAMAKEGLFDVEALLDQHLIWRPFSKHRSIPNPRSALVRYMQDPSTRREAAFSMILAYHNMIDIAGPPTAYFWAAQLLLGKTPDEVRALSHRVIEKELRRPLGTEFLKTKSKQQPLKIDKGLRPYPPMVKLIHRMQQAGFEIWIISATNRWTVEAYARKFLSVPPERIVGITPLVENGRITSKPDPSVPITGGPGKVAAIQRFIRKIPVFAAGDSVGDFEMLSMATTLRLFIDKGDPSLRKRIQQRRDQGETQWLIQRRKP
jgi:phosphoserine phosphatase